MSSHPLPYASSIGTRRRRGMLVSAAALMLGVAVCRAEDMPATSARATRTIEGIAFEFPPHHKALVLALAPKIAALNVESYTPGTLSAAAGASDDPAAALTLEHFRSTRNDYLESLAKLSGRTTPSELQQAAYDELLTAAGGVKTGYERLHRFMRTETSVKQVIIWDRPELLHRLKTGETIPGFALSEDGEHGTFLWGFKPPPDTAAERKPGKVKTELSSSFVDGRITFTGKIVPGAPAVSRDPPVAAAKQNEAATPYAVIISDADARLSLDALVEKIFVENIRAMRDRIRKSADAIEHAKIDGRDLAFTLLTETAGFGLKESLGPRPELLWISEGAARYLAWRVLHDRHPPEVALAAYDIRARIEQVAARRRDVNFARWRPGATTSDSNARQLDAAHETYAALLFFVMAQRFGADSVPRFFAEVTRTPPEKMHRRVLEKAFKKTTGQELERVLSDVLGPRRKSK